MNQSENSQQPQLASNSKALIPKIKTLLGAKDDTSRFVGLALLKSVLDNTPELRNNEESVAALWDGISPKFLDRLIRTGSKQLQKQQQTEELSENGQKKNTSDMLDLAVSVLHTFVSLLPDYAKRDDKMVNRIPHLVSSLLYCSKETSKLALETLVSLVSRPQGAEVFVKVEDISPLIEMAPSEPLVLDVLLYAWLNAVATVQDKYSLQTKIDNTIGSLVSSFKGTDAVTLLNFLANLLPKLDPTILPHDPKWLPAISKFIRQLVASRPTSAGRTAFTNLSAALLEAYHSQAPRLLFAEKGETKSSDNPFSYLLINLLLVDLRATLPTLLETLNSPEYSETSRRLASAFNVVSHFIGYLVRYLDSDLDDSSSSATQWVISPDLLLKLRKAISETMSLTTEYLRDRWDAAVSGALGLHPDARTTKVHSDFGARHTVAWDSASDNAPEDALILAAVRALAIWLREDDNDTLRKEATGLADMLLDLYRVGGRGKLDFRRAVLVAFEGIIVSKHGISAFLEHGGWEALATDLLSILEQSSTVSDENEAARGVEIVRVLLQVAEAERPGPREAWMDVVTRVAAWWVPDEKQPSIVEECQVAVLQLVTALVANSHPGMQKRYVHSTSAVVGIAEQLRGKIKGDAGLEEALEDVLVTLSKLR